MQKTLSVIDLNAIRSNALRVRSLIGDRFFYAVVKSDAYGHGAAEVSATIEDVVDGFCVAIADEGAALRIAGIQKPVLVLAPPMDVEDAQKIANYSLQATVADEKSAYLSKDLPCHVAVNTGMNRYGCNVRDVDRLTGMLNCVVGVYSHLYMPQDDEISFGQLSLFKGAAEAVKRRFPQAIAHVSASGGILRGGDFLLDAVRCGIMLYGYAPSGFTVDGLKPALKVYARLAQRTEFIGGGVGYNRADKDYGELFIYRLGYADGFSRTVPLGEKTLCMDAFVSEREEELLPVFTDADEYAQRCKTISYEVLCSVTRRSQRVYERRITL